MSAQKQVASGGTSLLGLLGLLFVGLKLTGFIDWSWWWVTAPFWGGAAVGVGLIAIAFALTGIVFVIGLFIDR